MFRCPSAMVPAGVPSPGVPYRGGHRDTGHCGVPGHGWDTGDTGTRTREQMRCTVLFLQAVGYRVFPQVILDIKEGVG